MAFYGFTLLRNGLQYDYPFRESLRSLSALCERVYVALGKSDDGTEKCLAEFPNLVVVPTVWDENLRQSGLILSQQTNTALEALRADVKTGWGIYLQADEVLSESDFSRIQSDSQAAEAGGCDALSFRYLHFWQSYQRIAIGWRWYPQEIRAIRLESGARSYGDAQSFAGVHKRFESDAFVYHYGHVREAGAYERKKTDFNRWWHSDAELAQVARKGARRDKHELTLPYLGPHPAFMAERKGEEKPVEKSRKILVYGREEDFPGWEERVGAQLQWTTSLRRVLAHDPADTVVLERPGLWARWLPVRSLRSRVPARMKSPQARDWTRDFQATLKFSEKGVYVK